MSESDPIEHSRQKSVLIAAGGTGGHMFPAQAFAEVCVARGWRTLLITDDHGARYAQGFPSAVQTIEIEAAPIIGGLLRRLKAIVSIQRGIGQTRRAIVDFGPDAVVGFGGYPAFPAMVAARGVRLPIVIQEQNAVLGRVNRRYARYASAVATGFERLDRAPPSVRQVVTGTLTRSQVQPYAGAAYPDFENGLRLLITGGSQGARVLGAPVAEAIAALPDALKMNLAVTHQVRPEAVEDVSALYGDAGVKAQVEAFFDDLPKRIAESHLVVSRAGASSVAEFALIGRPAVLVPLAIATDDHQTANAEALADAGAADVVQEADLTPPVLTALLVERLSTVDALSKRAAAAAALGRPDAAERLIRLVEQAS